MSSRITIARETLLEFLDKPYNTLLLDVVGGRFIKEVPWLLRALSPNLRCELGAGEAHLIRALRFEEVDGLFFTRRWLAEAMGEELRALLALRSLCLPMFLLEEDDLPKEVSPRGDEAPPSLDDLEVRECALLELMEPIPLTKQHAEGAGARLMTALRASRHRLRWLSRLDFDKPRQRIIEQLSDLLVDPSTGVTSPTFFSDRISFAINAAGASGRGVCCLVAELRWPLGGSATLTPGALTVLDKALRSCLRESDLVGKVAPGIYVIMLGGQGPKEGLIPAKRLIDMEWSRLHPEFHPALSLTVGLSGRSSPPEDGLSLILEAAHAVCRAKTGTVSIFDAEWGPIPGQSPVDRRLLEEGAGQLRRALPGLFPAPFSDISFYHHVMAILPPRLGEATVGRFPQLADALAVALGLPLELRRFIWRACLAADALTTSFNSMGEEARAKASSDIREPYHFSREVVELIVAVPGLGPELSMMQEVRRRLRGRLSGGERGRDDQGLAARVIEVVDSYVSLRAQGPELGFWEIEQALLGGKNWRYDEEVVDAFVGWLGEHRSEEGL